MIPARCRMKRLGRIFVVLFCFLPLLRLPAQTDDPSDIFLRAYMTSQQAEKLEHDNQFKAALAKYRSAGTLIDDLQKNHSDWQPAIVEYRGRKISESILRVQDKAATQSDLTAGSAPLPETAPAPEATAPVPKPSAEVATSRPSAPAPQVSNEAAIKEATKKLNDKVDQLQADLDKSRTQLESAQKEKESLNGRLQETNSKLTQAQGELDKSKGELEKTKGAERQARDQVVKAQDALKKAEAAGSPGTDKAQQALRAEIAHLKDDLTAAEEARFAAEKAKDQAGIKATEANKQIASVTKERDAALAQLKGVKEPDKRVQVLMAENNDLKQKLANAEKSVRELNADKPKKEKELADVKAQLEQLRGQLASSQKQNQEYETKMVAMRSQLDDLSTQLANAKLKGSTPEETAKLKKENEMLRAIVVREREEEARRDQSKKLLLAELDKLQIKSDTLNQQVELLTQPITKLSDEELALLRQPVVSISDHNPAAMKASFSFAKKSAMNDVTITGAQPKYPPAENTPPTAENNPPGAFNPDVPEALKPLARTAKDNFEQRKYRTAEKQYQEILTKSPNNLYSLSNLGVVYFRTNRFKAAELTLKKAVALAPNDEFARTTLGIVYYRQSKFDEALAELTKALAINPKSATAHNYLGITASQKGWQEAAEREILEAIQDNPDYADAHFNLAVIYATARPPAKELAKQHYAKATSLGTERDPSLEKLLH